MIPMIRRTMLFLSALLLTVPLRAAELPTAEPAAVGLSAEKLAGVDKVMNDLVEKKKIAGGVVAIARQGKVAYFKAFGKADLEAGKTMETDAIVRIYSMTKGIASAAALMLVDDGKLELDAPVSKYVAEFKDLKVHTDQGDRKPMREPTVRDLFLHTAGFTYGGGATPAHKAFREAKPLEAKDLDEMAKRMAAVPLAYDPGTSWEYSTSIDVLGLVIERASGVKLDKFLADRVFGPLDMRDTGFSVPADKLGRFAVNYQDDKGTLKPIDVPSKSKFAGNVTFFSAGGGLVSTARDYLRFLMMVRNGGELDGKRVLKVETVKLMTTNGLPKEAFPIRFGKQVRHGTGFGLGFSVRTADTEWDPAGRVGEYGWGGAASTHYWVSPKDDLIVVTLEQRMPYTFETEFALKGIIYGAVEAK